MEQETAATKEEIAEGDLILIDYVGKISNTDEIFDLTDEDRARSEGFYEDDVNYGAVPVLIGRGYVVEGLENNLIGQKFGEKVTIEVPAESAFGQRSSNQIKTISESQFRESDVRAQPGSLIRVGDKQGKVIAKSSGRVKVDFNHPLAGKDLEYEVEIRQKVEQMEEKVSEIVEYYLNECLSLEMEEGKISVVVDPEPQKIPEEILSDIKSDIKYVCDEIDEVELVGETEEEEEGEDE